MLPGEPHHLQVGDRHPRVRGTTREGTGTRTAGQAPRIRLRAELRQAPREQPPLGVVAGERQRAVVGGARLAGAPEAAQQLAACRAQVVVVVEREAVGVKRAAG